MTFWAHEYAYFSKERRKLKLFVLALLIFPFLNAQEQSAEIEQEKTFRLMFYNVENYFDSFDDTLTNDNEFLADGIRGWSYSRFLKKRNNIYKTIMALGKWEPPAIIGLCEVENRFVLKQLVYETPLAQFDYRIIHEESPDRRGIDVALLFDPRIIQVLHHRTFAVDFPFAPESKTRDILYVKGLVYGRDTLHIFVNHWPSRYGGELISRPKRNFVAQQLAMHIDSLLRENRNAAIVVMGDFNDFPSDISIKEKLKAGKSTDNNRLINLMPLDNYSIGTNKFEGIWGIFDQIMVSPILLLKDKGIFVKKEAQIFDENFLLQEDVRFFGKMPFRTFIGMKYKGGFSDHLPVFVDFTVK